MGEQVPADVATGAQELSSAVALASGRAGSGNVVSSTGVRGLDKDSLTKAEFDAAEFDKFTALAVTLDEAKQFAKSGGLRDK